MYGGISKQYMDWLRYFLRHPFGVGHIGVRGITVRYLKRLPVWCDVITTQLAHLVRWLGLAMVMVTMLIVILRYLFNIGAIGLQESVMYMHGILFLLGIPYGILRDTHVRVDIFYSKRSTVQQGVINTIGHLLFLLPVAALIFITSLPYVEASWRVLEGSPEVGGLPAVFLLKTLIPVTAALMFLQGLSEIIKLTSVYMNKAT